MLKVIIKPIIIKLGKISFSQHIISTKVPVFELAIMQTILFKNNKQTIRELKKLGICS